MWAMMEKLRRRETGTSVMKVPLKQCRQKLKLAQFGAQSKLILNPLAKNLSLRVDLSCDRLIADSHLTHYPFLLFEFYVLGST